MTKKAEAHLILHQDLTTFGRIYQAWTTKKISDEKFETALVSLIGLMQIHLERLEALDE
jgi:hypothetical protein